MKKLLVILMVLVSSVSFAGFTDVSEKAGVADTGLGKGVIITDLNGDSLVDIYVSNKGGSNKFYLNHGKNEFTTINTADYNGLTMGSVAADYDNDGDKDIYLANGTGNILYRNDGSGIFTDVTESAGVGFRKFTYGASFVDYDNDGWLDLYLSNYGVGAENVLYKNNGNGTFTDVTDKAGVKNNAWSWTSTWSDVDNDGDQDLYVVNGRYPAGEPNKLYINHNGVFKNEAVARGVDDKGWGLGAVFGDIDNDGDQDLFVSNYIGGSKLYINNGKGKFTKSKVKFAEGWGKGPTFGDIDHDGDLDLYVGDCKLANQLYLNDGKGNFADATESQPQLKCATVRTKGTAFADIDNDGDLDLYVVNWGAPNKLFKNEQNDDNWLKVRVIGIKTNKDGIGAKITIKDHCKIVAVREIKTATGFCAQEPNIAHFGLPKGKYDVVVRFTDGKEYVYHEVETGKILNAIEGGNSL